jgi:sulfite reductase subunit B
LGYEMQKNSILIVDDEPIVRHAIGEWLKEAGYLVSTAESGKDATALINKRNFDIVIVDVRPSEPVGLDVLKEIKSVRPRLKSAAIMAYPTAELLLEAENLRVDYLIKPSFPDELQRLIEESLLSVTVKEEKPIVEIKKRPEHPIEIVEARESYTITKYGFQSMVESLFGEMEVIGVKSKQGKYVYDRVSSFEELCLDYDVTLMPPTRYFLPVRETLFEFVGNGETKISPLVEAKPRAIIGIHPYDIKAIEMLDEVFMVTNPDPNYSARRRNTIIIGFDCLSPSPNSFASSMGTNVTETGFDLLLTDIGNDYIVTIGSEQGAILLKKCADLKIPTEQELTRRDAVREDALAKFELCLNIPREMLPKLLEDYYDDPYWESRSETCLSCGSCIMVCPTCFCFDVIDEVSLNLIEGRRFRQRSGCMLTDFASVGSGQNFRGDKASRFRHRILRKGKYILERYGKLGCVGCGRCTTACLADIASPLEVFNTIGDSAKLKRTASQIVLETQPESDIYAPCLAELVRVEELTPKEKVFSFKFKDGRPMNNRPGQFVEISVMGIGEAPISISSSPRKDGRFQLGVRNVGNVTKALHSLKTGATVGIRGPLGNGFPLEDLHGKDIILVGGGTGVFPIRSLVQYILNRRSLFGRVILLLGSKSPDDRLFVNDLAQWEESPEIDFHETVDKADERWRGNTGVITTLIPQIDIKAGQTMAVVVGPPIMYRFVIGELKKKGLSDKDIIVSLERRMECGIGKCGHCQIDGVYVCQEGPVFTVAELRNLRGAI